ncbi:MAG: hypothetical protein J7L54_01010 [Elusimicrobia bacterium]|nr:hypothetical protein [Elusimicrobiota bacterium]
MEEIFIEQLKVANGLVLVNVVLSSIVLIVSIFIFAKVRLLRKFLEKD